MISEKITIKTLISANTTKVWDYYTNPTHIVNWNFASDDWCCPKATNDLKVGGTYFSRMEAKDGSFGFDFEAVYTEVVIEEKLAYTMGDERVAKILFNKIEDKCEVTIEFDAETENPIEIQKGGWQAILNNFKKYTEVN